MAHFPVILDVELSNRCNLDCVMCPRLPQKLNMGDMSPELLDKLLDESLQHPQRTFRLHGIGEPLLSKQFQHAVRRIKESPGEHAVDLITNGHLLDRDIARFILRQEIDRVTVSVGAATPESYAQVRQSKHFDKVVRNAIKLIDERDRMGAPTQIDVQLVRIPPADQEVEAFVEFWSRFDVTVEIWHDLNWGRRATGKPVDPEPPACHHLWDYSVICWDGRIGICCIDGARLHVVGNLNDDSLAEIYNGDRIEAIRALHQRGESYVLPICADCSFRDGEHIAFSANVQKTGRRPEELPPVPRLPVLAG